MNDGHSAQWYYSMEAKFGGGIIITSVSLSRWLASYRVASFGK